MVATTDSALHPILRPTFAGPQVLDRSAAITWADIAGQDAAKRLVQEVVVWPMLNPQLFTVGARLG